MGAAAYNRGSLKLRRDLDAETAGKLEMLEPLCWADERALLRAEVERLRRDRERAVRCVQRLELALTMERARARENEETRREQVRHLTRWAERAERNWRYVSAIVRRYVSPRQVQEFHEDMTTERAPGAREE